MQDIFLTRVENCVRLQHVIRHVCNARSIGVMKIHTIMLRIVDIMVCKYNQTWASRSKNLWKPAILGSVP